MLTKHEMLKYLEILNDKLGAHGQFGEIVIVGGACLALSFGARDQTHDIDAIFEPSELMHKLIDEISRDEDIASDWLNDNVKISSTDKIKSEFYKEYSNLKIFTANAESMLAMKLLSARETGPDFDDAKFLMKQLRIKTCDEAIEILQKYYLRFFIPQKSYYFAEAVFNEYAADLNKT
jgi:hypothetical protein